MLQTPILQFLWKISCVKFWRKISGSCNVALFLQLCPYNAIFWLNIYIYIYRTDPISRRVYYLRFCIFGCGYYSSNYPSNTPDKKIINIVFLRFDMINKFPLKHVSIKLLLMAPFYVWKVKIFWWVYYSTASTIRVGTVYIIQ